MTIQQAWLALGLAALASSCFVSEGECTQAGLQVDPCTVSARAGQTIVIQAAPPGAPDSPVDFILPESAATAFAIQSEPNRLTLVSTQNVTGFFPVQATSQVDETKTGGATVAVAQANFGSTPPPFVLFGGDFPVGTKASATAAGGNLYYVAYADSSSSALGAGNPLNNFVRQYDVNTNQLLAQATDQFLSFGSKAAPVVVAPNVAADCQGFGYWVDSDAKNGYVLRRLAPRSQVVNEQVLGSYDSFRLDTLSVGCDGDLYFVASRAAQTGFDGPVLAAKVQPDGAVVLSGDFTSFNGVPCGRIVRLLPSGQRDSSFNVGGLGADARVSALAVQPDGKIVAGGEFTTFNGQTALNLVRLEANGVVDPSFNALGFALGGTGPIGVHAFALQEDGKLLVGGYFESYGQLFANGLVRVNTDGTPDLGFDIGGGATFGGQLTGEVWGITLVSGGAMLVAGDFTNFNFATAGSLVRLTSAGQVDTNFLASGAANDVVYSAQLVSGTQAVIVGEFTAYGGITSNCIARINIATGALDTAFAAAGPGPTQGGQVPPSLVACSVLPSGQLLIGGSFGSWAGDASHAYLVRLNADGTLDATYAADVFPDGLVVAIAQGSKGAAYIGGVFQTIGGQPQPYFASLDSGGVPQGGPVGGGGPTIFRISRFGQEPTPLLADSSTANFLSLITSMAVDKGGRLVAGSSDGDGFPYAARFIVDLSDESKQLATFDDAFFIGLQGGKGGSSSLVHPVIDVAVDAGDAIYLGVKAPAGDYVAGFNTLGQEVYRVATYTNVCPTDCLEAACGTEVPFENILSLGVSSGGALRVIDDIFTDGLPAPCQESVRLILLDPR